ncbi:Dedicator of cytokinesis protein 3 [Halocaridina rubra]|uniref:Dedicator of cytokinesis protein 3 n=1 Tax=Halocaridina rubra TaxID=373956 RepID=A0AAN8WLT1_HALRR
MDDEGGTTLRDGSHELCVYKCDERGRLNAPSEWRSAPDGIGDTLSRVTRVDGAETVKFLQDVLDALFAMFSTDDGNSTQHSGHVFQALVSIFSLLEDTKFEHFKPVMDAYITGHFAAALVYKGLISCVKHLSDLCPQTEKQEPIMRCFRSLEYIFKFIIQSRLLFARATGGQNEDSFRIDVDSLFESFAHLLNMHLDNIEVAQVTLLEHLQGACDQLILVLSPGEVSNHLSNLFNATPVESTKELTRAKLSAMKNAINSSLFDDDEGREILLETICTHLRQHVEGRLELRLCGDVLSDIIIIIHKHVKSRSMHRVRWFVFACLSQASFLS